MESLALLVAILMVVAFLAGPIAIGLTRLKSDFIILIVFRKLFHGLFVALSLWVGMMFFFSPGVPLIVHLIGFYGISMGYIASRREYFPEVRIISPLLARLGINTRSRSRSYDGEDSEGTSFTHGPVLKWKGNGRSSGSDGHGPEGQN
ncbi:unannotated protein [freshwater metagenome]|uniref:Unannotated protein n=1 Tax=freshwater metagenome TaxID=449393 RepID=A0A6J7W0Y0_9ZZZZ|nr:hypothetical protein [Actinomycetota bacterium]MSW63180.1 hypothetical protein [Actinomycetota bacterium]MSX90355.1 hypothetical protein [Actinomycetota bacterium]MSZ63660.1 hypothetical protein [Actinomycetota bacterium]MTA57465.1 hypothetical protein [Actinomycetota bacterium]